MQWPPKRGAGHCPCGSCSLIQPAHGLQKTAGAGGGQRFRAAVCILSSLVPPIAVLANTAHGHSDVLFIQGRLPVASFFPVPVAGRHLVVSGLWPSVLLECCIWQRYVLIFISQCHCEHLFHRLPWDFFSTVCSLVPLPLPLAVACRSVSRVFLRLCCSPGCCFPWPSMGFMPLRRSFAFMHCVVCCFVVLVNLTARACVF